MEIIKIKTYTGCTDDYFENIVRYPSNEDSVAVRGYGVDCSDPANAKRQFETMAKYYGNEGKNPFVQYILSFTKETAPDAESAMSITERVIEPMKSNHMLLIGEHEKHRADSYYHSHIYASTTDIKNGKMLHSTNKTNFEIAQRLADTTQQETLLVIEKTIHSNDSNNTSKPYEKMFKPRKIKE